MDTTRDLIRPHAEAMVRKLMLEGHVVPPGGYATASEEDVHLLVDDVTDRVIHGLNELSLDPTSSSFDKFGWCCDVPAPTR
jgi:hypothetical protein